jgi:hypothetical protein
MGMPVAVVRVIDGSLEIHDKVNLPPVDSPNACRQVGSDLLSLWSTIHDVEMARLP